MISLGFAMREGYFPEFRRVDDESYRLIYVVGFDCPYATYDSRSETWTDTCDVDPQ